MYRRNMVPFLLAICTSALIGLSAQSADEEYRLEMLGVVDTSQFPEVGIKFRILNSKGEPAKELPRADIVVYEDGKEVHRIKPKILREVPSSAMLVFDTSGSMARQEKLAEAQRASTIFLDQLHPDTHCGLVLFHHEPYGRYAARKDRGALFQAISECQAAGGTACFDAIKTALNEMDQDGRDKRHALVVMTDGRDVNSKAKLDEVIQLAKSLETPVHTIGLGEAGRQQPVRTLLVLDRSGSMSDRNKMTGLKRAALRYIDLLPEQGAETSLISFSSSVSSAEEFSADKATLKSKIQSLQPRGDTAIYDALWDALETMNAARVAGAGKPPRQALILLTDGLDNRSRHHPNDIVERAKQDDVRIYTLGLGTGREIDKNVLQGLADETGGQFFHIESPDKLTEVFEELSIALHDDGIDEQALQRLAASTGGQYYHVREIGKLKSAFEQLAATVENTHSIKFLSQRARQDGTARGIEIKLGSLTSTQAGYATHGLLTPQSHSGLYLTGLILLLVMMLLPMLWRSRTV
ncbi:MAG: VWA domain-containing protein [Planctomycetia bacterium]|nr:VWA domain-containing protein [Planctomycetia bacterium]